MTNHDISSGDRPRADRPKRRYFTAEYKLRMLEEYDAAEHGEKGACCAGRAFMTPVSSCGGVSVIPAS